MGKTKAQVEDMLKSSDVIELNLNERGSKSRYANDEFRIIM